jgi:heme exporter protein A
MIVAENLVKGFGLLPVLRSLTFTIERGRIAALLGPNGSGKTTLLRILAALSTPTDGKVMIGGWSLPTEAVQIRAQLGVVAHAPLLYDDLTAEENLRFFADLYSLTETTVRIGQVLDRVGLAKRRKDSVRTFSRGMQQRLALARAMLHDPAVYLLDEPYTGLDVSGATLLDDLLREWQTAGHTIVMSTHDLDRAAQHADQALILLNGKLVIDRPMRDIPDLTQLFNAAVSG